MVASVIRDIVEALHRALKKEAQWKRKNGTGGSGGSSHGNSGGSYGNSGSSIGGGSYGSAYSGGNYSRGVGHDYTSLSDPIDRSNLLFHLPEEVIVPINWTSDKLNRLVRWFLYTDLEKEFDEFRIDLWHSGDPNDILGYTAPSGSKAVGKGVTDGYYTIEFENDPAIANAAAHTVVVRDTLDGRVLDLGSFEPTGIKLGGVMTEVNKDTQFPITIDLRPAINVIAQADLTYNAKTGIAVWKIISLDPMTLEETTDAMQGILPVNVNGNGQGEVMFNIHFKDGLKQGTKIANRAGIVFDRNGVIMTPTWVNEVDTIAPTSAITSYKVKYGSEVTLEWTGEDEGAGIWCYDIYAQAAPNGPWHRVREGVTGQTATFTMTEEGEYGFCVVASDMAGNHEHKLMANELAGEELATGLEAIENGELTKGKSSSELYDLSGRRSDGRRTGVYIQGGKLWYFKR